MFEIFKLLIWIKRIHICTYSWSGNLISIYPYNFPTGYCFMWHKFSANKRLLITVMTFKFNVKQNEKLENCSPNKMLRVWKTMTLETFEIFSWNRFKARQTGSNCWLLEKLRVFTCTQLDSFGKSIFCAIFACKFS